MLMNILDENYIQMKIKYFFYQNMQKTQKIKFKHRKILKQSHFSKIFQKTILN